ncbi:hypothetical protein GBA52_003010 [Prunus armeniaca]|nr:hypothetical protein GBA52_003010 [Prunus armeniaca]
MLGKTEDSFGTPNRGYGRVLEGDCQTNSTHWIWRNGGRSTYHSGLFYHCSRMKKGSNNCHSGTEGHTLVSLRHSAVTPIRGLPNESFVFPNIFPLHHFKLDLL